MTKILSILICWLFLYFPALAWQPTQNVKVIVGQAPGGGNEFAFRSISDFIEKKNPGVRFIMEYRPGLDNVLALNYFAEQPADGHTITVVITHTAFVVAPTVYKQQIKTDPNTYTFVGVIAKSPMALVVPNNSKIATVPQLLTHLQNTQNKFNVGISGGTNLLTYAYLLEKMGSSTSQVQSIPYKSPSAAIADIVSQTLDMAIIPLSIAKGLTESKNIRLLAHTGSSPIKGLESVALMQDHVPGMTMDLPWTIFLPPNTPDNIKQWYIDQLHSAIKSTKIQELFLNNWATVDLNGQGAQGYKKYVTDVTKTWLPLSDRIFAKEKLEK